MAWVYLMGAGLLEVVWATSLKHADGLTRLGPSLLAFASAGVSFFLLSMALRALPAGTGYAVFVGIGAVGDQVAVAALIDEQFLVAEQGCVFSQLQRAVDRLPVVGAVVE